MKVLTSYANITTAEGERITYTYSEINENGDVINQDGKGIYIETDKEILKMLSTVKEHVKEHMESMPEPNEGE